MRVSLYRRKNESVPEASTQFGGANFRFSFLPGDAVAALSGARRV